MWASLPVRSASSSGCSGRWWRWSRGCTRFCSRSSSVSVKTAWEKRTKDPADPRRRSGRARPRGLYHPRPAVGRRAAADDRRARRAGRRPEPADRRPASGRPDHGAHGGRRRTRPANARPADALTAATRAASRWTPNRRRGSELYGAHLDAEERRDQTRDAELVADVRARSRARNRQEARDRWRAAAADKLRERQDRRRKAREHRPVRRRLRRLRQRVARSGSAASAAIVETAAGPGATTPGRGPSCRVGSPAKPGGGRRPGVLQQPPARNVPVGMAAVAQVPVRNGAGSAGVSQRWVNRGERPHENSINQYLSTVYVFPASEALVSPAAGRMAGSPPECRVGRRAGSRLPELLRSARRERREGTEEADADEPIQRASAVARRRACSP